MRIFLTVLFLIFSINNVYSYDSTKYAILLWKMTKAHKARGFIKETEWLL